MVRKPSSREGGLLPDSEAKRSLNDGELAGGSAAVTSELESPVSEMPISATHAAAPSASAIAAMDSRIVSARPIRRRDNTLSARTRSETIRSPNRHPRGTQPPPGDSLYQLPHWEPKVRHN